jgi:hypothetical protein
MVMRGERLPKGDLWKRATLGSAIKGNDIYRLWCDGCGRWAEREPAWFYVIYGVPLNTPHYNLAQRLVCGDCGSRKVGLQVIYIRPQDRNKRPLP